MALFMPLLFSRELEGFLTFQFGQLWSVICSIEFGLACVRGTFVLFGWMWNYVIKNDGK